MKKLINHQNNENTIQACCLLGEGQMFLRLATTLGYVYRASFFSSLNDTILQLPTDQLLMKNYGKVKKHIPEINFTFILPCIVKDLFLNNQPGALIIPILFCYKTLHVSGIFSAHHHEFSTVHSALVSFMQVSDDRFQAESG